MFNQRFYRILPSAFNFAGYVKNTDMHRYVDAFFILLGVFVASFVFTGLVAANFALKLCVAFLSTAAFAAAVAFFTKGGKRKNADYRTFVTYCIISDEKKIADMFRRAGVIDASERDANGFYPCGDGAAELHLKYSGPSKDQIVSLYKKCVAAEIKKLVVICTGFDRASVAVACTLPEVQFRFKSLKTIYRKAKKAGLVGRDELKPASRPSLKTLLPVVFNTKNSYRFAFSSLVLYAMSFLTPLRAYYIAVATVVLVLAVVSRVYGEKSDRSA